MRSILLCIAMLFTAEVLSAQQTVTITAVKDNTLYEDPEGLTSNGSGIYLFVGRTNQAGNNKRRAVIKFDLNGKIPSNAVVTWAKLKLNLSKSITGASDLRVHRLFADWGEGTSDAGANEGGGAAAATNDATWKHKFFNTQSWLTPGGDFVPSPSATKSVSGAGSYIFEDSLLWEDVLVWQQTPSLNFGWIVIGNETAQSAKRFDSRNNTTAANRPQLILEYFVPTIVRESGSAIDQFELKQNFPNPFNPSTAITFSLPYSGHTTLRIYDLLGNEVETIVSAFLPAGSHTVNVEGKHLSSGIYFYRLQSGVHAAAKKLMLLK